MSRIENLGDYNDVRIALQNADGSKKKLYKMIGDVAVAKAAPKYMAIGSAVVAVVGGVWAGKKGIDFLKDRKKKIENEPMLKEEFNEMLDDEF